jgi:serine/threonine protein kinase
MPRRGPTREQGWKLHVSATIISAGSVLARVLPILERERVAYKLAASLGCLADLNQGAGGLSQVGKFITVYPEHDQQAIALAVELDEATRGLAGPRVPSDRPLHAASLVHYRYGGFTGLHVTDSLGQVEPALRTPEGGLTADARLPRFQAPPWVEDPFQRAGVAAPPTEPDSRLFGGAYVIVSVLSQSAKGGVYLALDSREWPPPLRVLKEARRHLVTDRSGQDIRDRLRLQHQLLHEAKDSALPTAYELFECDGNLYLTMEYVEGTTLQAYVESYRRRGQQLPPLKLASLGQKIASALMRLHARGLLLRDLTPTNLMIRKGRVVILDLELAYQLGAEREPYGWGTPGYASPQQATAQRPAASDDVYALGATLYYGATGESPEYTSGATSIDRRRALTLLNPELPRSIANTIVEAMSQDADRRPGLAELDRRLSAAGRKVAAKPSTSGTRTPIRRPERALARAREAGDALLESATRDGEQLWWASVATMHQPEVQGVFLPRRQSISPNLHNGTAGIALFLAELAETTEDSRYANAAVSAAAWLDAAIEAPEDLLPGLHFGKAGIAVALARMTRLTGKRNYLDRAKQILDSIDPASVESPDFTHGWAGIGIARLFIATNGAEGEIAAARKIGDRLIANAEPLDEGLAWRQPDGSHQGLSGQRLSGFAHGSAGVGWFLLELAERTGDDSYRAAAAAAAAALVARSEPCLRGGRGSNWPLVLDQPDPERWFYWCHGAPGIGLFLTRAWEHTADPRLRRLALRAARTTATAGRRGGGTLCHGLAGNGSALLDAYRAFGDRFLLDAADDMAGLLDIYKRAGGRGQAGWPAESARTVTPDLLVGYAGAGAFFLALSRANEPRTRSVLPLGLAS